MAQPIEFGGWDYMFVQPTVDSWSVSFDGAEITHLWCQSLKKHSLSVSDLFQHLTIVSLSASELWEAKRFWDRSAFARWPETGDSPFPPSTLIFWMVLPGFCHSGLLICHFQSFSTGEKFTQLQNRSSQRYAAHSYRHTLCGIATHNNVISLAFIGIHTLIVHLAHYIFMFESETTL